jgi:hypothetical protein
VGPFEQKDRVLWREKPKNFLFFLFPHLFVIAALFEGGRIFDTLFFGDRVRWAVLTYVCELE